MTRIYQPSLPFRTETQIGKIGDTHALIVTNAIITINNRDQALATQRFLVPCADIDHVVEQVEADPFAPKVDPLLFANKFEHVTGKTDRTLHAPLTTFSIKDSLVYDVNNTLVTIDDICAYNPNSSINQTLTGKIVLPLTMAFNFLSFTYAEFGLDNAGLHIHEAEAALNNVAGITATIASIPYYNCDDRDQSLEVTINIDTYADAISQAAKQALAEIDPDGYRQNLSSLVFKVVLEPLLLPFVKAASEQPAINDED